MRHIALVLLTGLAFLFFGERLVASAPPQEIAKTVTFIFLADDAGNPRLNPQTGAPLANGTGFFVIVNNSAGPGVYGYVVTAKHVLRDENGSFFKRVFVRVNDTSGGSQFGFIDLQPSGDAKNLYVHKDVSVDIAVIPFLPDHAKFDYLAIATDMMQSKDDFKKSGIRPGSDVFFAGLFAPHVGDKTNVPIFRFGRVAMLPDDRIRWQENLNKPPEFVELYLLETMSFAGNSGSPVFFSLGVDRNPGTITIGQDQIFLAGVMRGNFNEPRVGALIQTPNAVAPVFAQNVGIAAVTPAYLLKEILFGEELTRARASNPIKVPDENK